MPLVIVVMALTLLTGLATVLIVGTMTETAVAAGYRQGIEAFYAADAAVEFAVADLAARVDWDAVLTGAEASAFADGPPGGTRRVGGRDIDLTRATEEVGALLASRATPPDAAARLYAYGPFDALLGAETARVPAYVCVWVAERVPDEDAAEEDPPVRLLYVVGRAYGPAGARRTVLVTLARALGAAAEPVVEVRGWEEPP